MDGGRISGKREGD
jgi:hypothetical protein